MTIPLIEKYRPKTLNELVASEQLLEKFNDFIKNKSIPHLLLTGTAGLGKTTTAKILAKSISDDVLYINASDETSVETIRTKVKGFCATMSFGGQKIVILDEFDAMSMNAMMMLRNVMEEFISNSRFILTCNYLNKVIDPIRSRCQVFEFKGADKVSILKRCAFILKEENVKFNKETIKKELTAIVDKCYPDIRKIIGSLEKFSVNGKFEFDERLLEEDGCELIELIKEKKISEIRQNIVGSIDYEILYRNLFDNSVELDEQKSVSIKLCVAEYLYRHSIIVDQEINFMGCIYQIIQILDE